MDMNTISRRRYRDSLVVEKEARETKMPCPLGTSETNDPCPFRPNRRRRCQFSFNEFTPVMLESNTTLNDAVPC